MNDIIKIIILALCFIIILGCIIVLSYNIAKKNNIKRMYNEVEKILESLIPPEKKEKFELNRLYREDYDYVFDTPAYLYYIKVIPNQGNQEICVNNSVKWQLRKSFNDESMRFVAQVEGLMRMDIDSHKPYKKIYIIYPNARSLLKYINECEMIFIHPDTDVYGTNIIPYVALKENPKLLRVEEEA